MTEFIPIEARSKEDMAEKGLQGLFDNYLKTAHLPLPSKCLIISDLHASDGLHDPLKGSGMEEAVVDLINSHEPYALLTSEVWDIWRGYSLEACQKAHPALTAALARKEAQGLLYWVDSNHSRDLLTLPQVYVFEGYGKKVFLDHGHAFDWPNCRGWKVGRLTVRTADKLGIDPETSPHPSNPDRHGLVRSMRQKLADDNPEWDFFWGHTHYFDNTLRYRVKMKDEQAKPNELYIDAAQFDDKTMEKLSELQNNHNDGSPTTGKLSYFLMEEGSIQAVNP